MQVNDWWIDVDGKNISGKTVGSFRIVKDWDIDDLYVYVAGEKISAHKAGDIKGKPKYDFYLSVAIDDKGEVEKRYKLLTTYLSVTYEKLISPSDIEIKEVKDCHI